VSGHSSTDAIKFLHLNTLFFFLFFFLFFPSVSFFFSQPRVVCFGFTLFFFLSSSFSSPPLTHTHTHTHTFCPRFFSIPRTIGSHFQDLTFHFLNELESVKKFVGAGSKFRECQCANLSLPHTHTHTHHTKTPPTAFFFLPSCPTPTNFFYVPSFFYVLVNISLSQVQPSTTPKFTPNNITRKNLPG